MDPVDKIAGRHDGVVTRTQALEAGMSASAIDRRVASGRWRRLGSGIFMPAGQPVTAHAQLRVAVHRCGRGAVASGPSAAWWTGILDRAPTFTWVTIPRERRHRDRSVHVRRRDLGADDVTVVRRLPVTVTALTVLETAVVFEQAKPGMGTEFLDRALQSRCTLPQLHRAHDRNPGRSGSRCAAAMLVDAAAGGESEAERIFLRMLRAARITGWTCAVESCGYIIDVAFVRERVAVEVDGWAYHRAVDRMARDAKKQNALVNDGWTVLRFTYHRLIQEPDLVLAEVRSALAQ